MGWADLFACHLIGYCLVLVQSDKKAGEIKLKASSNTLTSDEIFIKIKE